MSWPFVPQRVPVQKQYSEQQDAAAAATDGVIASSYLRYPCRVCGKRFAYKARRKSHMRCHTQERPYKCQYCGIGFTFTSARKCHERLHTGDKPYQCRFCLRRFTQIGTMQNHVRKHHGPESKAACRSSSRVTSSELPLLVNDCATESSVPVQQCLTVDIPSAADRSVSVINRVTTVKADQGDLVCLVTPVSLAQLTYSQTPAVHNDAQVPTPPAIETPLLLSPASSSHTPADSSSTASSAVKSRPKRTPEGYYECAVCAKVLKHASTLKSHMLRHTGEKPYQCKICLRRYRQGGHLKDHIMRMHWDNVAAEHRRQWQIRANADDAMGAAAQEHFEQIKNRNVEILSGHSGQAQPGTDAVDTSAQSAHLLKNTLLLCKLMSLANAQPLKPL